MAALMVWGAGVKLGATGGPPPPVVSAERQRMDNLVPRPRFVMPESGTLTLPPQLTVDWGNLPPTWRDDVAARLDAVAVQGGVAWSAPGESGAPAGLLFRFTNQGRFGPLVKEGYELEVAPDGITVTSDSPEGFFYALVTLQQLLPPVAVWHRPPTLALGTVVDHPSYSWRGLMLDSSRNYQSVDVIESLLESMARHKLNRFHWHLTDDQGWRLQVPGWPALTEKGAWRTEVDGRVTGGFYTSGQVREIVEFARRRQITVVPEIDVPGHSSAALAAYPELSGPGKPREVPLNWNVADGVLSLGRPEVKRFVADLLSTLVDLFPGPWVHWGGDEVFRSPWMSNTQSLAWMKSLKIGTADAALAAFWKDVAGQTLSRGKIPIGWDETVAYSPPAGSLVQWWDNPERGLAALAHGYGVISSWKWNSYFDYPEFPWDSDRATWMPLVSMNDVAKNPFAPAGATPAQKARVVGLEATLFTERVSQGKWARKLFPRLALFAEMAWRAVPGGVPGWESRLAFHRSRLEDWGVGMFEPGR